jgi:hypothetical protein
VIHASAWGGERRAELARFPRETVIPPSAIRRK